MRVIIDADYIVYAAGFAGEHTRYLLQYADDGQWSPGLETFAERPAPEKLAEAAQIWTRLELEPIENVLHSTKLMLQKIAHQVEQRTGEEPESVEVFLTGTANYRERWATIRPYKGNRDPRHKPAYMRQIRDYMVRQWGAQVVNWYEADDQVSMIQTADPENVCVCGIDKDLLQVPGLHYVPGKGFKQVTERLGILRLYYQILAGDATDNVGGCYKTGAKKAQAIVKQVAAGTPTAELEHKLWPAALDAYQASIEKYGAEACSYDNAEKAALENARLVYMLREAPVDPAYPPAWEPKI